MRDLRRFLAAHPELLLVILLAVLALLLFDLTAIDLTVSGYFFDAAHGAWPAASHGAVSFLNLHFLEWFTTFATLAAAACLVIARFAAHGREWRRIGTFFLLTLAVGPGLVVNGFFKTQWGRPRPEHVIGFGGDQVFRRPFEPGKGGAPERGGAGRSFPSGHAAVAYWTTSAFFVARYLLPASAPVVLLASLSLGTVVGIARVAAGRHFMSDIIWAGLIVFTVNGLLAYGVMKLPRRPNRSGFHP